MTYHIIVGSLTDGTSMYTETSRRRAYKLARSALADCCCGSAIAEVQDDTGRTIAAWRYDERGRIVRVVP